MLANSFFNIKPTWWLADYSIDFLARLDEVQEELLYYPPRQRLRRRWH